MEGRCLCKRVARVKEIMQIACDSKLLPPRLADAKKRGIVMGKWKSFCAAGVVVCLVAVAVFC
jgi:hypothetical protein